AAEKANAEEGCKVNVVNARFVKPIDVEMIRATLAHDRFVITLEEGTKVGGFGSALLEAANEMGLDTRRVQRLALPDRFVEHGVRDELLADEGISVSAIAQQCVEKSRTSIGC
ncbi:MAG: transketolase C-terminal domain-containing protein, partial [Planctomycetota bacterium]